MRKRRIISLVMLSVLLLTGCGGPQTSQTKKSAKATVKFAYGDDKILQSYEGTMAREEQGERDLRGLLDQFYLSAFRNETEKQQVIITANEDITSYEVSVSDFKQGEHTLPAEAFEVGHEYYHEVSAIFSANSKMSTGMYPDAVLPMATAKEYQLNSIQKGNNQAVLLTVTVPKEQEPGIYNGKITILLDGEKTIFDATVEVLDYTLPDTPLVETCAQMGTEWLMDLMLDDTQEMYDTLVEQFKSYGISVQFLTNTYARNNANAEDHEIEIKKAVEKALEVAQDSKVASYGIQLRGTTHPTLQYQLDEETSRKILQAYIDKSIETGVNILDKGFVYLGSLIDEPDAWGEVAIERCKYVCLQYNALLLDLVDYAKGKGATQEMLYSIQHLTHVVTSNNTTRFPDVDRYTMGPHYMDSLATIEEYQELWEKGKGFWWYTTGNPKVPYVNFHVDHLGTAPRLMFWMMREYGVEGYLYWETIYNRDIYPDYTTGEGYSNGIELYDIMRHNANIGDAYFMYPGKVFGLDKAVPSIRLYYMRDGIEDYSAITDMTESLLPELASKYGATISAEGIMDELYGSLYALNQVHIDGTIMNATKSRLNTLLVWATHGIAVSDYTVHSDGTVTAKIYAPEDVEVKIGDKVAKGTQTLTGGGKVYDFNTKIGTVDISILGQNFVMKEQTMKNLTAESIDGIDFEYSEGVTKGAAAQVVTIDDTTAVNIRTTADTLYTYYDIKKGSLSADDESLLLYMNLNSGSKVKMSVEIYGSRSLRYVETVYLHPGENVIRLDRICDLDWTKIGTAEGVRLSFTNEEKDLVGADVTVKNVVTIRTEE